LDIALNGTPVSVQVRSAFPRQGSAAVAFGLKQPSNFSLRLREPEWAAPLEARVNGLPVELKKDDKGWALIPAREWKDGDQITLAFKLTGRVVLGAHGNQDKAALAWGPFVLAYDENRNAGLPKSQALGLTSQREDAALALKAGEDLAFTAKVRGAGRPEPFAATFVPFAEAGRDGGSYRVWLRAPGVPLAQNSSILSNGQESRSRPGNVEGSITDGDPASFVVTFDGRKADQDWFAVALEEPTQIKRVVFHPGKVFHDGGWFDCSAGQPRLQIQRLKAGPWETLGQFASYPATTATDPVGLKDGVSQSFSFRLSEPVKVVALRVIGKPACGDNPNQAFSSCGELIAFSD